ncbi:MAG: hypothetical protein AAF533_16195 [Acidobacteriota bacterium]
MHDDVRRAIRVQNFSLALFCLALLLAAPGSRADSVQSGFIADDTEEGACAPADATFELLALKRDQDVTATTDWHWSTDRNTVGGSYVGGFSYTVLGCNFTVRMRPLDRVHFFITAEPETPGRGARLALDSARVHVQPNATTLQVVGETIPPSIPDHAGTGLIITGDGEPVDVDWGEGPVSYPRRAGNDVQVVFGALIDLQPEIYEPASSCGVGAVEELYGATAPGLGALVGYNIYAREGEEAPEEWLATDWLAFVPHLPEGMTPPPDDGTPSGLRDLDAIPSNGNEYLFLRHVGGAFSRPGLPGRGGLGGWRGPGRGPTPPRVPGPRGGSFTRWYAIQPVVAGEHFDFDATTPIAQVPLGFEPKGPGGFLDLDADGIAEFLSPQAVFAGETGLGLTHDGRPLVSAPVRFVGERDGGSLPDPPRPPRWHW